MIEIEDLIEYIVIVITSMEFDIEVKSMLMDNKKMTIYNSRLKSQW